MHNNYYWNIDVYLHHILLPSNQGHSGIEDFVSMWLHFGRVDHKQLYTFRHGWCLVITTYVLLTYVCCREALCSCWYKCRLQEQYRCHHSSKQAGTQLEMNNVVH